MVKQKVALTISQVEAFIKNASSFQEELMIKCMVKMGMRVSELTNFKIEWINFQDKMIRIQKNNTPFKWEPKYCSERELPIPENLVLDLKKFINNRKTGYVFKSRKKSKSYKYNEESIIRKINTISKKVFGKNLGTHIFRRTYASYLNSTGHDIVKISKRLGHGDLKTTFLYLQDIPDRSDYDKTRDMEIMKV